MLEYLNILFLYKNYGVNQNSYGTAVYTAYNICKLSREPNFRI